MDDHSMANYSSGKQKGFSTLLYLLSTIKSFVFTATIIRCSFFENSILHKIRFKFQSINECEY